MQGQRAPLHTGGATMKRNRAPCLGEIGGEGGEEGVEDFNKN